MKAYWKYTAAAMAVVAALSLTGCGQQTQQAEQPQLVKAIQVGSERVGTTAGTYSGTVKGRYQSNLSFQAGGRITARNVQLGSQVHAGDVLMTVDPKDIAQAVNQTQAKVDAAAAQLQLAQSNLNRYQQLYDMDAISASVLDQYQTPTTRLRPSITRPWPLNRPRKTSCPIRSLRPMPTVSLLPYRPKSARSSLPVRLSSPWFIQGTWKSRSTCQKINWLTSRWART